MPSETTVFLLVVIGLISYLACLLYNANERYIAELLEIREKLRGQTTTSYALASNVGGYESLVREMEEREDQLKDEMAGMFSREDIEKAWKLCHELDAELFDVRQQLLRKQNGNQAAETKSDEVLAKTRSELVNSRKEILEKDRKIDEQNVALEKLRDEATELRINLIMKDRELQTAQKPSGSSVAARPSADTPASAPTAPSTPIPARPSQNVQLGLEVDELIRDGRRTAESSSSTHLIPSTSSSASTAYSKPSTTSDNSLHSTPAPARPSKLFTAPVTPAATVPTTVNISATPAATKSVKLTLKAPKPPPTTDSTPQNFQTPSLFTAKPFPSGRNATLSEQLDWHRARSFACGMPPFPRVRRDGPTPAERLWLLVKPSPPSSPTASPLTPLSPRSPLAAA